MRKLSYIVALTAAAVVTLAGWGTKTPTPTPSANVPEVSETPAIQSPDMSALVSPDTTGTPSPIPSAATSEATGANSPAA